MAASAWTPTKQQRFARFIAGYTAIAAAIQHKWRMNRPWAYGDLTAGSGWLTYGSEVLEGSPLIALKAFAEHEGFRVDCVLVEQHPARCAELSAALDELFASWPNETRDRIRCNLFGIDHKVVLSTDWTSRSEKPPEYGLLYWDGLGADICPFDELNRWMQHLPHHDLLVMASGCAPKRHGLGRERVDAMFRRTVRRHLWVAKPETAWQWTFGLMSNWEPLGQRLSNCDLQFVRWNSAIGHNYLDQLGTTHHERHTRDNPSLFDEQ